MASDAIPRSRLIAGAVVALAAVAGIVAVGLIRVLAAPDVATTCTHVLELAAAAGEPAGPSEREACERRYAERRASEGWRRFARVARCTRAAKSIPEAARC